MYVRIRMHTCVHVHNTGMKHVICMYIHVRMYDTLSLPLRYVQSWIDGREVQSEKANLTILFDRYVPSCLETLRTRFKKITPITDISMIQTLCYLLDTLLTPENTPPDTAKDVYELYFVFAAVWAFGGSMFQDQVHKCIYVHMHVYQKVSRLSM